MKLILACLLLSAIALGNAISVGGAIYASNIVGVAGTTNATPGNLGEYVAGAVNTPTSVPGTTNQWGECGSVALTPGDWQVSGVITYIANGATVTLADLGISSTAGNSATGMNEGDNWVESIAVPSAGGHESLAIPAFRIQVGASTTFFLKCKISFTVATPQYQARISARRMR